MGALTAHGQQLHIRNKLSTFVTDSAPMFLSGALWGGRSVLGGKAQAQPMAAANTPDAALNLLIEGNARYVANQPRERDFSAGRASRSQGQAPFAAILGCADSRVAPELAFDQGSGDLFVVRVTGNFVTADGLASLVIWCRCTPQKNAREFLRARVRSRPLA